MAEGGGRPWSSRRRNRRRQQNDREGNAEEIDRDLLRVVLSDSEDYVPEDAKSTSSVACSCASDKDFQDEQRNVDPSNVKSCPNLSDLDPEIRCRSIRWLTNKVTRRKSTKECEKKSADKNRKSDRDENGPSYYARCLQEAKRVRHKAELDAINRRTRPQVQRRRPLSLFSYRPGNQDEGVQDAGRRRRFSFSWGFRRDELNAEVVDDENASPVVGTPPSPPHEQGRSIKAISFEEFERQRKEKARLKAAQHKLEYFLVNDIVSITNCPWYWGKINRFEAEKVSYFNLIKLALTTNDKMWQIWVRFI